MTARTSGSGSAVPRPAARGRPRVLLDANALFLAVRVGFPLEAEVARWRPGAVLAVPASVRGELERLAKGLTPGAAAALAIAVRYEEVPTDGRGDDGVIDAAVRLGASVVTADRELRRRLALRGISVLVPRDRHRLEPVPGRSPTRTALRPPPRAPPRGNG